MLDASAARYSRKDASTPLRSSEAGYVDQALMLLRLADIAAATAAAAATVMAPLASQVAPPISRATSRRADDLHPISTCQIRSYPDLLPLCLLAARRSS